MYYYIPVFHSITIFYSIFYCTSILLSIERTPERSWWLLENGYVGPVSFVIYISGYAVDVLSTRSTDSELDSVCNEVAHGWKVMEEENCGWKAKFRRAFSCL